ncbi:hypothetical protein LguiA_011076 [Lonicera macranthoides]
MFYFSPFLAVIIYIYTMNPIPAWLRKLWDEWDIRMMVFASLTLQIILICFGGRRKSIRGIWIEVVVWSTYLMADSAALFALGKLSDASGNDDSCENKKGPDNGLLVLWSPLLLLHLGGPDTITAYSVEDVRLWLRHALGVVLHVGLAVYVLLRFWTGKSEWVAFLTLPLFVAGIVKYSERTYVLWCTNSTFPKPLLPIPVSNVNDVVDGLSADADSDAKLVVLSYLWLQASAPCISSSGNFDQQNTSSEVKSIIWRNDHVNTAFKFFEFQLGFMYDVLYTKASRIYTKAGCIIRLISFFCVASALLGFIIINKDDYSSVDVNFTYILLVGAVVLELYAILLIIFSDLAIVWMCKHSKIWLVKCMSRLIAPLVVRHGKRWTGSLPTLNILDLALYKTKPTMLQKVTKYFEMDEKFKAFMCQRDVYELEPLKVLIMKEVRLLLGFFCKVNNWYRFFGERGELALDRHRNGGKLRWSITGKSLDISIVIWHIATNYCYYLDNNDPTKETLREASKLLSDYMLYLIVSHPLMLGNNVTACDVSGLLGSYVQLMEDAKKEGFSDDRAAICRRMIELEPNVCTPNYGGSTDALASIQYGRIHIDACDLSSILRGDNYKDEKWEIISEVWAEMLFHGAANCELGTHLQQLRKGGEFISQVWLLLFINGLISPSPRDFLRPLFADADVIQQVRGEGFAQY